MVWVEEYSTPTHYWFISFQLLLWDVQIQNVSARIVSAANAVTVNARTVNVASVQQKAQQQTAVTSTDGGSCCPLTVSISLSRYEKKTLIR